MAKKPATTWKLKRNKNGSTSIFEKKHGKWKKTSGSTSLKPKKK